MPKIDRFAKSPHAPIIDHLRKLRGRVDLVALAPTFLRSLERLAQIAARDCTVLLSGETGTGKEMVARALHYTSTRAGGPFRAVNLGELPDSLLEDELCGHARGAFTGATGRRPGVLEETHGGTVLLDEVDSLSPLGQVMLLRVLEDRLYRPLGSKGTRPSDVRWLAATNAPLLRLIADGRFRQDLYYRLAVLEIRIPPLRDRPEDIPALAAHFLGKHGGGKKRLSSEALAHLLGQPWPGNVRELESTILRALVATDDEVIGAEHLRPPDASASVTTGSYHALRDAALGRFERDYLPRLMAQHQNIVTHAALAAGLGRRHLQRLLQRHPVTVASLSHPATNRPHQPLATASPTEAPSHSPSTRCVLDDAPVPRLPSEPRETTNPAPAKFLAGELPMDCPDSEP